MSNKLFFATVVGVNGGCFFFFRFQSFQLVVNCWFGAFGGLDSWNPQQ